MGRRSGEGNAEPPQATLEKIVTGETAPGDEEFFSALLGVQHEILGPLRNVAGNPAWFEGVERS
jgi:hypothetical protein